jgi:hypothetical protein
MRRTLTFTTPDEILSDCQQLAAGPCTMLGKWTLAQNIRHLADGIDCFYDGFGFRVNWLLRTFLGRFLKRRFLRLRMPRGIRLPSSADRLLPPLDADLPDALERLRSSLLRLAQEPPRHPHPVFGPMTHDEVRQLMLRHAELHLSFAVPSRETQVDGPARATTINQLPS